MMTTEERQLKSDLISALLIAHRLIEGFLSGDKLDVLRLENYYTEIFAVVEGLGKLGFLITPALEAAGQESMECLQ